MSRVVPRDPESASRRNARLSRLWLLWGVSALVPIAILASALFSLPADAMPPAIAAAAFACLVPIGLAIVLLRRIERERQRLAKQVSKLARDLEHAQDDLWEKHNHEERLQQVENSSRAQSRFIATVSHEIRTPLNGILGMSDLLAGSSLSPEQKVYNDAVRHSGTALLSLINDILDFSRIDTGRLDLMPGETNLTALLETIAEFLAPRAHEKGIDIAALVDPTLPETAYFDAERVKQVLFNLVGNAIKFTAQGGVIVSAERGLDGLIFSVTDTGIGIAPEAQTRIFQEFEQADASTTRAFGGTGLGLAIARRIVQSLGGSLMVESSEGEGARFHFTLPMDLPPVVWSPALGGLSAFHIGPASPETEALERQFAAEGAGFMTAPSIAAAQAKLAAAGAAGEPFSLLLVDARLILEPSELLPALEVAALGASADNLPPSIVLLAPRDRHRLESIQKAGFNSYLMRPVRAGSLRAIARNMLDKNGKPQSGFVEDPADRISGTAKAGPAQSDAPTEMLKALLVEDNPINALLARALLERAGFQVETRVSGADAVAHFREVVDFGLILMDLHMPGMDGACAASHIREIEAAQERMPVTILALTADATNEARDRALAAGMDAVLTKPLDIDLFRELLGRERSRVLTLRNIPGDRPVTKL